MQLGQDWRNLQHVCHPRLIVYDSTFLLKSDVLCQKVRIKQINVKTTFCLLDYILLTVGIREELQKKDSCQGLINLRAPWHPQLGWGMGAPSTSWIPKESFAGISKFLKPAMIRMCANHVLICRAKLILSQATCNVPICCSVHCIHSKVSLLWAMTTLM